MTWNGLTVCVPALIVVWLLVSRINRRIERRENERLLAESLMRRHAGSVHVLSRSGLRHRTLDMDRMTPEEFAQALEEIEREETL